MRDIDFSVGPCLEYTQFLHGTLLFLSGNNKYIGDVSIGITNSGEYIAHDISEIFPTSFEIKETAPAPTANADNLVRDISSEAVSKHIVSETESNSNNDSDKFEENSEAEERLSRNDRNYMDAVNRGDMETAQRLVDEAAKEFGVYIDEDNEAEAPTDFYHATNATFNKFDPEYGENTYAMGAGLQARTVKQVNLQVISLFKMFTTVILSCIMIIAIYLAL